MTLPWKAKLDRSISVMENRISRLLHQHYAGVLQERWLPWKAGFFELDVDKGYPVETCFLDK